MPELLRQSPYYTNNASEADYFYVRIEPCNLIEPNERIEPMFCVAIGSCIVGPCIVLCSHPVLASLVLYLMYMQADVWLYWGWLDVEEIVEEIRKAGPW